MQTHSILVVDDEKQNRALLAELLKGNYKVILAKNGMQALERTQEHHPDLIMLDVLMPEMDGYQTIRELKADPLTMDIPVIFISALDSVDDEEKGLALGAADYISKPFHPAIVQARVRSHLSLCDALKKLRIQQQAMCRHAAIVDRYVLVLNVDAEWRVTHVSEEFCRVAGYTKDELSGQPLRMLLHPDNPGTLFHEAPQEAMRGKSWNGPLTYRAKDGHPIWVETHIEPIWDVAHQNIVGYTAVDHDVSDKKRIEELSVTDHLTRLFNRLKLDEVLKSEFARAERFNSPLSFILLDVDYFKKVNDTWGHQVGDQVLVAVAQTLRSNIRNVDIAGRWGGEEFVIVSPETDARGAALLAEKLRASIQNIAFPPVENITCSFGVAQLRPGVGIEDLIRNADLALYNAKAGGRNRVEIHAP